MLVPQFLEIAFYFPHTRKLMLAFASRLEVGSEFFYVAAVDIQCAWTAQISAGGGRGVGAGSGLRKL